MQKVKFLNYLLSNSYLIMEDNIGRQILNSNSFKAFQNHNCLVNIT